MRAPLLIVVASSVVDHIVEPEADVYLGWMFRQSDDVLDVVEALGKVLMRMVVATWLGVATQNTAMEAPELGGIASSQLAPGVNPSRYLGHCSSAV